MRTASEMVQDKEQMHHDLLRRGGIAEDEMVTRIGDDMRFRFSMKMVSDLTFVLEVDRRDVLSDMGSMMAHALKYGGRRSYLSWSSELACPGDRRGNREWRFEFF